MFASFTVFLSNQNSTGEDTTTTRNTVRLVLYLVICDGDPTLLLTNTGSSILGPLCQPKYDTVRPSKDPKEPNETFRWLGSLRLHNPYKRVTRRQSDCCPKQTLGQVQRDSFVSVRLISNDSTIHLHYFFPTLKLRPIHLFTAYTQS